MISLVSSIIDVKVRKNFAISLVEEILTKKPYTKFITLSLLADTIARSVFDVSKISVECLKNLSSEDFWQFYSADCWTMAEYEKRYNDIQGNNVENELSKIMYRYANEGRPGGLNVV